MTRISILAGLSVRGVEQRQTMSNKQLKVAGIVFGLAIVVVMIVPASRRHVLGVVRGESVQNGKYMSEWIAQLSDPDEDKRVAAAGALGNLDSRARPALPELLRLLRDDKSARIRGEAAFSISKIAYGVKRTGKHATEIFDTVVAALDDPDPRTRMNVAMALGMLEADAAPALPALEKGIRNEENKVRVLTFPLTIREQMLADIGFMGEDGKDGLKLLEDMLVDDEETTRKRSAMSLGQLGPAAKEAVPKLKEAIRDPAESDLVKESAREALQLIDPQEAAKLVED
jgi:HEAT repeat protein